MQLGAHQVLLGCTLSMFLLFVLLLTNNTILHLLLHFTAYIPNPQPTPTHQRL